MCIRDRVRRAHGPHHGVLGGRQGQRHAVLGLAPVDQRMIAGDHDRHVRGAGQPDGLFRAAPDHVHGQPDGLVGVVHQAQHAVVGGADVAAGRDVAQGERAARALLHPERLAHLPSVRARLVVDQRHAVHGDEPAGGDRAQRVRAAAPVEQVEQPGPRAHAERPAGRVGRDGAGLGGERHPVHGLAEHRLAPLGQPGAGGDGVGQGAAVPVLHERVAELADHGDPGHIAQRQQPVVRQQHERAPRRLPGQRLVLGAVDHVVVDVVVRRRRVELAQPEPDRQRVPDGGVDVRLGQQPLGQGRAQVAERGLGAVVVLGEAVDPGLDRVRVRLGQRVVVALRRGEVARRVRVADHQQVVRRPGPQRLPDQRAEVRGPPVDQVVRRHHGHRHALLDGGAEGGQLVLVQHPRRQVAGGRAPVGLVVVAEEVLERGGCLEGSGSAPR